MADTRTLTIEELQDLTGFGRRTIAYYIQRRLLPRVGRRGPRTRYPEVFLHRLQFIRRVRELEGEGRLRAVSLSEFRTLFDRLTDEQIATVGQGRTSANQLWALLSEGPDWPVVGRRASDANDELPILTAAVTEQEILDQSAVAAPSAATPERPSVSRLAELMGSVEKVAGSDSITRAETWTRLPVTSNIALSVRNLSDKDLERVEALAAELKQLNGHHK